MVLGMKKIFYKKEEVETTKQRGKRREKPHRPKPHINNIFWGILRSGGQE
jgi:hypothetical protein